MAEYRRGPHTVYDIQYHLVWTTKYRYRILTGEVGERLRDLVRQVCMTREVRILRGHVSSDHVHVLVSCPPHLSVSTLMQLLKGKSSMVLQQEYPSLRKRYWGRHLWSRGYFCATVGVVTEAMVSAYIEQQETSSSDGFRMEGTDDRA